MEIVTTSDHEFKEIVEEYEEEILIQEEVLEPPPTDSANTAPTQGKPQCITSIFYIHRIYIYVCVVHLCCRKILWKPHAFMLLRLWMVVRSQTYYPEHILAYGSRKPCHFLVMGSGSF